MHEEAFIWRDGSRGAMHDIPMGNHKLTGLKTPTATTDAANKAYVDARDALRASKSHTHTQSQVLGLTTALATKVPLAGGTMTGYLSLHHDPTSNLHAATKHYVDAHGIPTGVIVMWSGTIATIPTGWALCDGTNGPDLSDKFIMGAKAGTENTSGGSNSITLSSSNFPRHNHTVVGSSTSTSSVSVTHRHSAKSLNQTVDHSHGGTTTFQDQTHKHPGVTGYQSHSHAHRYSTWVVGSIRITGGTYRMSYAKTGVTKTSESSNASHTHSFWTKAPSVSHKHSFTTGGQSAGHQHEIHVLNSDERDLLTRKIAPTTSTSHRHYVSIPSKSTSYFGSSTTAAIDNRPAYYALAFIIKL
jgi:microcystin-dependent protein